MSQAGRSVDVKAVGRVLVRGTRRAVLTVVGFALIAVGLAGLILPILPGWVLIIGGFAVLSREYSWARSGLMFASRQAARGGASLRSLAQRRRAKPVVEVVLPPAEVVIDLTKASDEAVRQPGAPLQETERTA
jgi:hypothetical protein